MRTDFAPRPMTVPQLLAEVAARQPDAHFVEYYDEWVTYGQFVAQVRQIAGALWRAGIGHGDVVALYLPNTLWHLRYFFGILATRAAATHLSPLDAPAELLHKMRDSGARMLVTISAEPFRTRAIQLAEATGVKVVMCDDPIALEGADHRVPAGLTDHVDFVAGADEAPLIPEGAGPGDLALLQYTGGTTGVTKAAMLTQGNLSASAQSFVAFYGHEDQSGPGRKVLTYSPLSHILGLSTHMLRRMWEGATLHLRQRFNAEEAVDLIRRHKINSLGGVPTMWLAMTQVPGIKRADLESLMFAGTGGAPLAPELYQRVYELTGLRLRGGYGLTETSPAGTQIPPDVPEECRDTIGVPLPGVDVRIVAVDDPRRVLGVDEVGEIAIRGPNVTAGYWNKPEETEKAFCDGWLLTGDIGRMDRLGFFYIVDRKKDMVVSSGFNVYPVAVENAITRHPDVIEAVAIGVPDDYRGESVKAFVVQRPGSTPLRLEDLNTFLRDYLGPQELPRALEIRADIPRTPVGKASRKALRDEEAARRAKAEGR
ncbi:AMP-binding protein [uncultured Paracoccus sp.]|uniref:AMP-binding protein n=1 Tax=Paracoccus sp. S1E-3 TaxID=2756130 RepID=UPI0015EF6C77|nr:AMP-binding protein [uncultured Paracoccus sp.]MBA4489606.1 AMP-binding protein [Paracoccus sp. S1E-3]